MCHSDWFVILVKKKTFILNKYIVLHVFKYTVIGFPECHFEKE